MPDYTTWNPADKYADITLAGGDLIASSALGKFPGGVRSILGVSSGKFYWEITVNDAGYDLSRIGVCTAAATIANYNYRVASDTEGWVIQRYYGYYHNNVRKGDSNWNYDAPDVIRIALDMDNGYVWISDGSAGAWYNGGDPATGTNPTYTGLTGPIYAVWCPYSQSNAAQVTANFGASAFTYAVPAGFHSGLFTQADLAIDLPALEIDMVAGAKLAIDLPALEVSGTLRSQIVDIFESTFPSYSPEIPIETVPRSKVDLAINLPALTVNAVAGAKLAINLPALTVEGAVTVKTRVALAIDLPALEVNAKCGAKFALDLPALTVAGTLSKTTGASLEVFLPALTVDAHAIQEHLADLAINLKPLTFEATALRGNVLSANIDLPALTVAIDAWHELTGGLDIILPALVFSINAQQAIRFSGDGTAASPRYELAYSRDRTGCGE